VLRLRSRASHLLNFSLEIIWPFRVSLLISGFVVEVSIAQPMEDSYMTAKAYPIKLEPNPFSQFHISAGFQVGDFLFLSGHVPIDDEGRPVNSGFDEQARLTFENLQRTLRQGGSCLDEIIKVTIYVTNMTLFRSKIMDLRQKWFKPPYPADTLVEVSALGHPSRLIEIEAIALRNGQIDR